MHAIETEQVENYTVNIYYDEDGGRDAFDCDMPKTWGIDMSNHRDYKSPTYGDRCPIDFLRLLIAKPESLDEEDQQALDNFNANYVWLPIYLYDHSGRTVRTTPFSCQWDSGCAGIVYISKAEAEAAKEGFDDVDQYLVDTVKELDYYMTGQVYGYVIEDENGENIDSRWGFVGDSDYCLTEGKATAEAILNSLPKQGTLFQDEPEEEEV